VRLWKERIMKTDTSLAVREVAVQLLPPPVQPKKLIPRIQLLEIISPTPEGGQSSGATRLASGDNGFCKTGIWGISERAERLWQTCLLEDTEQISNPWSPLQLWSPVPLLRFIACGKLLQFQDGEKGRIGWALFAWVNGAGFALDGARLEQIAAICAPRFQLARELYDLFRKHAPGIHHSEYDDHYLTPRIMKALTEFGVDRFTSHEQFVAVMLLAGWLAVQEGDIYTMRFIISREHGHPLDKAHIHLLRTEWTGLNQSSRSHPLARLWGEYYTSVGVRSLIADAAWNGLQLARKGNWSVKEFLLNAFDMGIDLAREGNREADSYVGPLKLNDPDILTFEKYSGIKMVDATRESVWKALCNAAAAGHYQNAHGYDLTDALETFRDAYTDALFWGLAAQMIKDIPKSN
jgi:hypothetical protein